MDAPRMTLSEMRRVLKARDLWLTKSLGQNFLHDQNQIDRIVSLAELGAQDQILEIGPGLGALTQRFAVMEVERGLIIEKDRRLLDWAQEGALGQYEGFEWIHDDALKWLKRQSRDWSGWKLVSNLPYSVGSPILVELALSARGPDRLVVTLQLEVIQRLRARPNEADYGLLSVLLGLYYEPRGWFKIPRGCFFPEPDVDSACLCMTRKPDRVISTELEPVYRRVVKSAFGQRRKTLVRSLSREWSTERVQEALQHAGIDGKARPESVDIPEFVALATAFLEPR